MFVFLFIALTNSASAQPGFSITQVTERCSSILSPGPIATAIENGVRTDKERIYAAPLLKQACPMFEKLKDDKEKTKAVQALIAAYSYAETNCNKTARMVKDAHSGLFWQLTTASDRKTIKDTPCGYLEATDANQVNCVLYALNPVGKGKLPVLEHLEARVNKGFPESIQRRFRNVVAHLVPACNGLPDKPLSTPPSHLNEAPPTVKE